ncbi:Fatty acid desaturase [Streptomyces sp. YIM 130001]|uniref:fatty acid desaturase n=1 Tax=Streptomyces sp. YIM 130001 TaxID=2259644 RepID=UPI000E649B05|nr:fatty acid desaturase [Streptomyces sp. YIM 130001]RII07943.1 Fatty acid desaturase [Streptomyces sp. YIM 130001]
MGVNSTGHWNPFESITANEPESEIKAGRVAFIEQPRNVNTEVRESVSSAIQRTFPRPAATLLEAVVTWISGCPHLGQKPLVHRSRLGYTVEAFGGFILTVAAGVLAVSAHLWWLLPFQWLILSGRGWALFNIFHHATHDTLFRSRRVNEVLAFSVSLMSFSSSLESYREQHIRSHHTRAMCTYQDVEAPLLDLGFPTGMPKSFYYRRLAYLILSPWTYVLYVRYRLFDWQRGEPWYRKAALWTFAASLVAGAYWFGFVPELLLAYVVPMFVVFNVTGLLGMFSEHHWGTLLDAPARLRMVLLVHSRFLLDEAPAPTLPTGRRIGAWGLWWLRLVGYHLVVRVAVLPSDSSPHDHHHRHPRTEDWTRSTYERFEHVVDGCPGFAQYPHTHAWSLGEAMNRVFTRMSAAPLPDPALDDQQTRAVRRLLARVRSVPTGPDRSSPADLLSESPRLAEDQKAPLT